MTRVKSSPRLCILGSDPHPTKGHSVSVLKRIQPRTPSISIFYHFPPRNLPVNANTFTNGILTPVHLKNQMQNEKEGSLSVQRHVKEARERQYDCYSEEVCILGSDPRSQTRI